MTIRKNAKGTTTKAKTAKRKRKYKRRPRLPIMVSPKEYAVLVAAAGRAAGRHVYGRPIPVIGWQANYTGITVWSRAVLLAAVKAGTQPTAQGTPPPLPVRGRRLRGRPELPAHDRRTKCIPIELDASDREALDGVAQAADMKSSTWARAVLLAAAVGVSKGGPCRA